VSDVLALLLASDGYAVQCANNGRQALDQLVGGLRPCLILLDFHMPFMDGNAFRTKQLADGIQTDVPVILYSADAAILAMDLKVEAVIRKPFDFDELLQLVERTCARSH